MLIFRNKTFVSVFVFILVSSSIMGQGGLKGRVYDARTLKPLTRVAIAFKGKTQGAVTDSLGQFSFSININEPVSLEFSHLGYKTVVQEFVKSEIDIKIYLQEYFIPLNPIVVTATLAPQSTWEVPAMVSVIDTVSLHSESALNVDNYLRTIPGLYIDRSNGVYSKNAAVTMRGLDGSNRVLILYDGAPLNKTSYGFINWSLISPDMVDQIEVVHGPSSALFGNNAMAGVINIRTKEPLNSPFYGSITGEAGGFGLYGTRAMVGGNVPIAKKGVKIMANGFWRQGDGYITEPPQTRDSTSSRSYLTEKGAVLKTIIPISDSSTFYLGGNLYEDKRGSGRKVYMNDGSFDAYTTSRIRFGYNGSFDGLKIEAYGYAQKEDYFRQNETVNTSGDYKLFHTYQESGDLGLWVNASKNISSNNQLIAGIDLKHGWMDAEDIYRTSTDDIERDGKASFGAIFLQDEYSILKSKLKILGGVRLYAASFYDGYLKVSDPTKNTGFSRDTLAYFPKDSWFSLNPKFGVRCLPMNWFSFYGSVASGFMPAKLDDLCSSRKITKGFKLANPKLKPEHLLTYEVGAGVLAGAKTRIDIAFYLSNGTDFQYFVSTGDSIDTGGEGLKPIVKRENITSVQIFGGELSIHSSPLKWLVLRGNYSFNKSKIDSYRANTNYNLDLKGMALAEVPTSQASFECVVLNRYFNAGLVWVYIGTQWGDEINNYKIDAWNTFNIRVWKEIKAVKLTLDVQDLLDNPYTDKKGLISPGRFFQFSATYSFK